MQQRQKCGIDALSTWIELVELIFKKKGETQQQRITQWIDQRNIRTTGLSNTELPKG